MLRALRAVVLVTTFLVALVAGVLLHVNTAPLRRDVAVRVTELLGSLFAGKVTIVSIGRIGLDGVDGVSGRISDPEGNTVLVVNDVHARADVVAIVKSVLSGSGPMVIELNGVRVRSAEVAVDVDANGTLGIARAFLPRTPSTSTAAGRGVRLAIDHAAIDHAWAHGVPVPGLVVDADVDAVRGKLLIVPPSTTIDVDSVTLVSRGMVNGANLRGTLTGHVAVPSANGGAVGVVGAWRGSIGGIDASAQATLDGDAVDVAVDVPEASPEAIRGLWPASTISESAAAHVDAKGTLTRVELHAHAGLGGASVDLTGPVSIAAGQHADLHLDVRALDLHAIVPAAPPSSLSANGDVSLTRKEDGTLQGGAQIALDRGLIAGEPVPAGTVHGSVSYDAHTGLRADARISAQEPGAPTVLVLHMKQSQDGSLQVAFDADVNAPHLEKIPRLRTTVRGRTVLKTHGVVDLTRGRIEGKVKAEIDDFGEGGVAHAHHASISISASGTLSSPQLDLDVHGDVLDVAGYRFSTAHIEAHGPAKNLHVKVHLHGDDAPNIEADADLGLAAVPTVSNVEAELKWKGERLRLTVASVGIGGGGIDVEGIEVTGLGGPLHLSVHTAHDTLRVKGDARDLDVASLARIIRVQERLDGCLLAFDVDATVKREGAEGTATIDLGTCSLDKVKGVTAHVDATMHGRKISGNAKGELPGVGSINFTTSSIAIGGTAPVLASWRRAWGKVKFAGSIDLSKLATVLPTGTLPFDELLGTLTLNGKLERDTMDDMTPGFQLSVRTSGLEVVGASRRITDVDGSSTIIPPSWHSEGIDVALDSRIDGDSGFADVDLRLNDVKGELVDVDLKSSTVPFSNLLATPRRALSLLEAVQFNARVTVPKRPLDELPPVLGIEEGHGDIEGVATIVGSAEKPMIDADVKLTAARGHAEGLAIPADFDLTMHYDGAHAALKLSALVKESRVIDAKAAVDVAMADLLAGNTDAWTASAKAHLASFPIGALSALNDHQVLGTVSGDVTLDGLHTDAKAKVDLTVAGLKAGDVTYLSGHLGATLGDGVMDASLRFDQTDGFINAHAHAGAKWGAMMVPALDPTKEFDCTLTANRFRLAILLPYVDNVFTELDARMDANVTTKLDPTSHTAKLSGTVSIDQGRFELASVGGEFHDASMKVTFTPDGLVRVEDVKASGISGRLLAAATIRLENLVPVAANASIEIPSRNPLLLTVEGSQVGTLVGKMSVAAKLSADRNTITADVDVPTLHVELPLSSSQDVQALGPLEGVAIGTSGPKGFVPERLDAARVELSAPSNKTLKVAVKLGKDVQVKRGATLKVALEGTPVITVTDAVNASGQIRLTSGTIDVQGKSFTIDSGTVTFVGDPTNPQVKVTASWIASDEDKTRVYADFVGPLKTGTVTLRSDPEHPRSEVLALILFGTTDGLTPSSQANSSTTTGAGVAGGAAAAPLNRALESFGLGGVSTRVDTSTANPRPEVEVQIARDISVQVAYVIGTPPPGQAPDTTFLMVDWHFVRQWSLETTFGSAGTSIMDVIWQYHY
jgi:translocation and assembly module TamB